MSAESHGPGSDTSMELPEQIDAMSKKLQRCLEIMDNQILIGQPEVTKLILATSLVSGGHGLITGLPGTGKSTLFSQMSHVLGLEFSRIQGTTDLMPADITGGEVLNKETGGFHLDKGPIFGEFVMFDEINRAPPRTQSALLQAMQEREVTVGGETYPLPNPSIVAATRNPLEQEGTYPLPEAQLDRFLMDIKIEYPDFDDELKVLMMMTDPNQGQKPKLERVLNAGDLLAAQNLAEKVEVGEKFYGRTLKAVRSLRPMSSRDEKINKEVNDSVAVMPSTRAAAAFIRAARALALIEGEYEIQPRHMKMLARPVLMHRMALNFSAKASGTDLGKMIDEAVEREFTLSNDGPTM